MAYKDFQKCAAPKVSLCPPLIMSIAALRSVVQTWSCHVVS